MSDIRKPSLDRDELIAQIGNLRNLDSNLRVFGAELHKYRFNAPADESSILAFEKRYGIDLPADYREYIATVSDGGVGPNYGLKPLAEAAKGSNPSKSFPSTGEPFGEVRGTFDYADCPGLIWLTDNGCATTDNLVVNGASYGKIWSILEESDYCCSNSFGEWLRDWFRSAIATIRREALIPRIRRGMPLSEVREILGTELVPNNPAKTVEGPYWLAFPDCNANFEFSCGDRVISIDHRAHVIIPCRIRAEKLR